MKRYWKGIFITAIVVLTIGTYYIQSAIAENKNPEFVMSTTAGNEAEVKDLIFNASYHENRKRDSLWISAEGTMYSQELSYIDRLGGRHTDPQIVHLQEEYRNFMRGKPADPSKFYEDERMLLYVEENTDSLYSSDGISLRLEILDKSSNDTKTMTIKVPDTTDDNFLNVEDVQMVNGEINVITRNFLQMRQTGFGTSEELHVYQIDVGVQEVVYDETIRLDNESSESVRFYSEYISDANLGSTEYAVFKVDREELQQKNGEYYQEKTGTELIAYNLKTNEQEKLELPEKVEKAIDTDSLSNSMGGLHLGIKDGKMYLADRYKDHDKQANILVVDVETGETLYEGSFEMKHPEENQDNYHLSINELIIEGEKS
ncbi:hypothetical protein [Virgibacillus ainsalahensis]